MSYKDYIKDEYDYQPLVMSYAKGKDMGHIYRLHYKGRVVYVGKSVSIASRIESHKNKGAFVFDDVSVISIPKIYLNYVEKKEILHYKPIYNISGIPKGMRKLYEEYEDEILSYDAHMPKYSIPEKGYYYKDSIAYRIIKDSVYFETNTMIFIPDKGIDVIKKRNTILTISDVQYIESCHELLYIPKEKKQKLPKNVKVKKKDGRTVITTTITVENTLTDSTIIYFGRYKDCNVCFRDIENNEPWYAKWLRENWFDKNLYDLNEKIRLRKLNRLTE